MAAVVDKITANYIQIWILEIQTIINTTSDLRSIQILYELWIQILHTV